MLVQNCKNVLTPFTKSLVNKRNLQKETIRRKNGTSPRLPTFFIRQLATVFREQRKTCFSVVMVQYIQEVFIKMYT